MKHRVPGATTAAATVAALVLLAGAPAWAQPAEIPIQGTLTDSDGVPLSGTHTVVFSLYASQSGGEALYTETHSVAVDQGAFTVFLGTVDTLDLALFDGAKIHVGIKVGSDDEMSPRLPFGSVPYAAFAKETAAVPAGAVMFFALEQCPAGWSELVAARGRVVVGLPSEGTLEGTVGNALDDRENRTHTHAVTATIAAGSGTHAHSVTIPAHNHVWARFDGARFRAHNASGGLFDIAGEIQRSAASPPDPVIRLLGRLGGAAIDLHTSMTNATTVGTGTGGGHSHPVTASAGNATTGQVIPYIQLLTCVKS